MIRRKDVATTDAKEWLRAAWKPVRIYGLGVLTVGSPDPIYRLTLTAAVAKAETAAGGAIWRDLESDVRHLARALGAPVEVWSNNGRAGVTPIPGRSKLITSLHP